MSEEKNVEEPKKDEKKPKKLSDTPAAIRMRELRKKRAIAAGRESGVAGRPKMMSKDCEDYIIETMRKDSECGIFHNVTSISDLVLFVG
jgi:hypothetical protein